MKVRGALSHDYSWPFMKMGHKGCAAVRLWVCRFSWCGGHNTFLRWGIQHHWDDSSAKGITATSGQPESISRHEGPRRWCNLYHRTPQRLVFNLQYRHKLSNDPLAVTSGKQSSESRGHLNVWRIIILLRLLAGHTLIGGLVTVERQKTFHLFLGFLCHNRNHNPLGLKPLVKDLLKAIGALMLQKFSY